jgi:hypothetical protein
VFNQLEHNVSYVYHPLNRFKTLHFVRTVNLSPTILTTNIDLFLNITK